MGSHFVMYLANMQGLFIFSCHFLFFLLFSDLNFDVIFTSDVYVLLFSCASVTVVKVSRFLFSAFSVLGTWKIPA